MYVGPGIVNIIFTHKNAEVNNIYPCFSFYAFILGRITYFKRIFFFYLYQITHWSYQPKTVDDN